MTQLTPAQIEPALIRLYGEHFRSKFADDLGRSRGTITKWWKKPDQPLPEVVHGRVSQLLDLQASRAEEATGGPA